MKLCTVAPLISTVKSRVVAEVMKVLIVLIAHYARSCIKLSECALTGRRVVHESLETPVHPPRSLAACCVSQNRVTDGGTVVLIVCFCSVISVYYEREGVDGGYSIVIAHTRDLRKSRGVSTSVMNDARRLLVQRVAAGNE